MLNNFHSPSILIVDDEPDNFDVIEALLYNQNYQLHYASSGRNAIDTLENLQTELILLDVMMPELDGIQVCRLIKAQRNWQSIPIIMVTALTTKENLAECLAAGADDFISKPVNGMELRARVQSMLRIKRQYDDLQALLQLREDMVKMIVHDLRNPLTNILLSADMLRVGKLPLEKQQQKLKQISLYGHRLQLLIDDLLIMAKLESGKPTLNRTEVDLCSLCTSIVSDFKPIADAKNITIVLNLSETAGSVNVDASLLRRVLDNLLSNAVKFSPKNSQILMQAEFCQTESANAHKQPFSPQDATRAIVRVADWGQGIQQDQRQKIFDKFEVGALMEGVSQIGLGLAFCKLAIEAHNGTILIEDNQPQGSIFTISLPLSY